MAGLPVPHDLAIETVRDDSGLNEWIDIWLVPVPDGVRQRPTTFVGSVPPVPDRPRSGPVGTFQHPLYASDS